MPSVLFTLNDVHRLITSENDVLVDVARQFYDELRYNCNPDCYNFYYQNVELDAADAVKIYWRSRNQLDTEDAEDRDFWRAQRQIRITGSNAKNLKAAACANNAYERTKNIIFNNWPGNDNTKYGRDKENVVLKMFRNRNKREGTVRLNCGLMVNKNAPWLGYSPDGFFKPKDFNKEPILLEVKCPQAGRFNSVNNLYSQLKYLKYNNAERKYVLKETAAYYAQIQLGLTLFDLSKAYLLIYCEYDRAYVEIPVYFDEEYARNMLQDLCEEYIEYYLPVLVDYSDELYINARR